MSKSPSVAVVMAHFDDYNGVCFTIQHLRMVTDIPIEFIVLDTSATTKPDVHAALTQFCSDANVTLLASNDIRGTSPSRNVVIAAATADIVICLDCHVLINDSAIHAVIRYFSTEQNQRNIVSGPMLYDDLLKTRSPTHLNPQWSAQMWGRWGVAWLSKKQELFTVVENLETHVCEFYQLTGNNTLPTLTFDMPADIDINGHEQVLREMGFTQWLSTAKHDDVITIPGQGLGCFAVWRKNWPGFEKNAVGFGGEELCVHERYRQIGGAAECLAGFTWWHRFFRGSTYTPPYSSPVWERIRNYVLWFNSLNLPLDEIKQHFVTADNSDMSIEDWVRLVNDPVNYTPIHAVAYTEYQPVATSAESTRSIASLQNWMTNSPSASNQYIPMISAFAKLCTSAAEFSISRDTAVGLMSCRGVIHCFNEQYNDSVFKTLHELNQREMTSQYVRTLHTHQVLSVREAITPLPNRVDLLLLHTVHNGERITAELDALANDVDRFIVICDTQKHAYRGEDDGNGMMIPIRDWILSHPEWFIASHSQIQYGITILGKQFSDRPIKPVRFITDGPGTELQLLLHNMDVELSANCNCANLLATMNNWGSKGCRDNLSIVIDSVRQSKHQWGIEQKLEDGSLRAAIMLMYKGMQSWTGLKTGLTMLLTATFDPVEVLVLMAIAQAEAKGL